MGCRKVRKNLDGTETDQKGSEERRSKGTPEKGSPGRPQSDTSAF